MKTVDKWFAVCALSALLIVVGGIIVVGGTATNIATAGGTAGVMTLVYAFGRAAYASDWNR